jgi:nitroreductase/Pyruvate/2-oxoacid:ferredoxin oxidoreductase delta subunit
MTLKKLKIKGKFVNISIDQSKCSKCNKCLDVCPLTQSGGFESLEDDNARHLCLQCGSCVAVCTAAAISINGSNGHVPISSLPSADNMLNLIKQRRSVRSFLNKPVSEEDWKKLLEAVKYAPTGHNVQLIDICIIQSPEILKQVTEIGMKLSKTMADRIHKPVFSTIYKRMLGKGTYQTFSDISLFYNKLSEFYGAGEDPVLFDAPALMLFIGPKSEFMSKTDADLAAQTVALYAPTLGLGTCYSGTVSAAFSGLYPGIKKVVNIPEGAAVFNVLIVGYPKHKASFVPARKDRNVYYI